MCRPFVASPPEAESPSASRRHSLPHIPMACGDGMRVSAQDVGPNRGRQKRALARSPTDFRPRENRPSTSRSKEHAAR